MKNLFFLFTYKVKVLSIAFDQMIFLVPRMMYKSTWVLWDAVWFLDTLIARWLLCVQTWWCRCYFSLAVRSASSKWNSTEAHDATSSEHSRKRPITCGITAYLEFFCYLFVDKNFCSKLIMFVPVLFYMSLCCIFLSFIYLLYDLHTRYLLHN